MFEDICGRIPWKAQYKNNQRYIKLSTFDLALCGKQYDHLPHSFWTEYDSANNYVPLEDRKPSARYPFPKMMANLIGRKMFGGRQAPKFVHDNPVVVQAANRLVKESKLVRKMLTATKWATIGSSVVTFKMLKSDENQGAKMCARVYKSRFVYPKFDGYDRLVSLTIAYTAAGSTFINQDMPTDWEDKPLQPGVDYWYVRVIKPREEITYKPMLSVDWNVLPPTPGSPYRAQLVEMPAPFSTKHDIDFVQAEWITIEGEDPDGECLFAQQLPMNVDVDFNISQLNRATRYNGCPQLVLIGEQIDENNGDEKDGQSGKTLNRSPSTTIQFPGVEKQEGGETSGGGDAKLLEMNGKGLEVSWNSIEKQIDIMLTTAGINRKNPNAAGGVISGSAISLVNEDFIDTCEEVSNAVRDGAYLSIVKKMLRVAVMAKHPAALKVNPDEIDALDIKCPKMYALSPADLAQFMVAVPPNVEAGVLDATTMGDFIGKELDLEDDEQSRDDDPDTLISTDDKPISGEPTPGE